MIVEERIYTIQPERMKEYLALYESEGFPIQKKVLRMLGYFQTEIGVLNQVVHLWVYDSMEDRSRKARRIADGAGVEGLRRQGEAVLCQAGMPNHGSAAMVADSLEAPPRPDGPLFNPWSTKRWMFSSCRSS